MFKKIIDNIKLKLATSSLNNNLTEEIKNESSYTEKDYDGQFLTLEEAKKLKRNLNSQGINFDESLKDVNIFNDEIIQDSNHDFEINKELKDKISSGQKIENKLGLKRKA